VETLFIKIDQLVHFSIQLNLFRRFLTALAVTLMHKDFFDKFVNHRRCQRVKVFVLLDKGDKLVGRFAALFKTGKGCFRR